MIGVVVEADLHPEHVLQRGRPHPRRHPLLHHPHEPELQHPADERRHRQHSEVPRGILHRIPGLLFIREGERFHGFCQDDRQDWVLRTEGQGADHSGQHADPLRATELGQAEQRGLVGLQDGGGARFLGVLFVVDGEAMGGFPGRALLGPSLLLLLDSGFFHLGPAHRGRDSICTGLGRHQPEIHSLLLHQGVVVPALHDHAALEDKDHITVDHSRQSVGHRNRGHLPPRGGQRVQGLLHHSLAGGVQR
mmetsp:Transcript_2933/g.6957  ORF Transcript_2933/g.6957 Transcript_2933/m.6957 type:complete len:249 (-) Transcript_2933:1672-2418(-)